MFFKVILTIKGNKIRRCNYGKEDRKETSKEGSGQEAHTRQESVGEEGSQEGSF
jgi:hypothetical protein